MASCSSIVLCHPVSDPVWPLFVVPWGKREPFVGGNGVFFLSSGSYIYTNIYII
jgi:hypothetical protein